MAIRFRCPHCRQLLGISAAQAGQVVDCPTCARALRVPAQKEKAKPVIETPRLNPEDQQLNAALDELVALSDLSEPAPSPQAPSRPEPPSIAHSHVHEQPGTVQGQPQFDIRQQPAQYQTPTPENANGNHQTAPRTQLAQTPPPQSVPPTAPVQPPLMAPQPEPMNRVYEGVIEPVSMSPQPQAEIVRSHHPVSTQPPATAYSPANHQADYSAELNQLAQGQPVPTLTVPQSVDMSQYDPPRRSIAIPVLLALVAGAAGGYYGRIWETGTLKPATYTNQKQTFTAGEDKTAGDGASPNSKTPPSVAVGQIAITGQVKYQSPSGEYRPDGGARVIAFPVDRVPLNRIVTPGIRAVDPPEDQRRVVREFLDQGGNVASVDDDGSYHLRLEKPGEYHVLVVSHYQARTEAQIPASDNEVLGPWFEKGSGVLGRVAYSLATVRFDGNMPERHEVRFAR